MISKKALSPVVATALLLVVAVTAVVGFQTWFQNYSSQLFTDVESQDSINSVNIDSVVNNKLYVKVGENTTISQIKLGNKSCNLGNKSLSKGMNSIDLGTCPIGSDEFEDVVVFTDKGILQENHQLKNTDTMIDCSSLNGSEWIRVPGNSNLGTDSFCVMKYEAKNVSGTPTSQPSQTPWVNINQIDARNVCSSLGSDYHLITDPEWMTIARNAEAQPENWNSSHVGIGYIWTGHNDNSPSNALSVSDDTDPYDQTGDSGTGSCDGSRDSWPSENPWGCEGQKRTLQISTGNTIWDIGGNVWEWTNDTTDNADLDTNSAGWHKWTEITGYDYLEPLNSSLSYINGVGRVYTSTKTNRNFRRGGYWDTGRYAGSFTLDLHLTPASKNTNIGFRCTYTP